MHIDRIKMAGGFLVLALAAGSCAVARGKEVVRWDFAQGQQGWQANPHVKDLVVSAEGLAFSSTGIDPWIESPPMDLSTSGMTRVRVRMKSDADPHAELFYGPTFQADRSVRFTVVNDGQWHEYPVWIPQPLGLGTRLRLDPTGSEGRIVVASIQVETLVSLEPPQFKRPRKPSKGLARAATVSSGELRLEHYRRDLGDFVLKVDGKEMAGGYRTEQIGLMIDEGACWLPLEKADVSHASGSKNEITITALLKDDRAGQWKVVRSFKAGPQPGSICVETTFAVDRDCEVIHLPWLTLFPGLGAFGERKTQGLLAGLEYLDNEPSSSEADITTPEHIRRVPDPVKITFPLMAVNYGGRYVGLIWEPSDLTAVVFDSPDRIYNSGAHVMALSAPVVGDGRFENALVAHSPFVIKAGQPLTARATIIGGLGDTVVPAVRQYVEIRGLPAVPEFKGGFDAAVRLLSHGWLDSAINEGGFFRHAVWGESFKAGPAADAVVYMDWLANHAREPNMVERLTSSRDLAMKKLPQDQPHMSAVSHTRTPNPPLVLGGVFPYVERRGADAESLLAHFDEQGVKLYRPGTVDYGSTHFAQHANGHAAPDIVHILEAATLSADPKLTEQGLALLDKQTALYANTTPRGAQVWEVPLHTPDILASAYLVRAYTLGYLISGKPEYLEQARYWAWTGVPFVYLANPTEGQVGPYATIAVLGATNWKAPIWFGQPVQWCGLVYGSALHLLSQYDPEGPWATLANGITAAGLQMTWPTSDAKRQGLLPDYFLLRPQRSEGPAINPGTVQTHLPELFDKGSFYEVRRLSKTGRFLHAPCAIHDLQEANGSVTFSVDGWGSKVFYVLLAGVEKAPMVTVRPTRPNARPQDSAGQGATEFNAQRRLLTITLRQPSEIQVRF
ncbi:MAG: hypothetical protein KBE65_01635 [Phycisphaerae bacterium]|nr:hypothetical protein [Phycisphaerae bacterium]